MGSNLNAHICYGFIIDRYIDEDELPDVFIDTLSFEEVAKITYSEPEDLDSLNFITAVLKKKFPALDMAFPGTEDGDELVIHIESSESVAYYAAEPLEVKPFTLDEEAQINEVAALFEKEAQWLLFPSYG